MSRQWRRSPVACFCGYCGTSREILKGEPAVYVRVKPEGRELVRCQNCAGEKAPDDLPELNEPGGIETSGFTRIGKVAPKRTRGALKTAAREWTPYREAGEEG